MSEPIPLEVRKEIAKSLWDLITARAGIGSLTQKSAQKYVGPEIDRLQRSMEAIFGTKTPRSVENTPILAWVAGKVDDAEMGSRFFEFDDAFTDVVQLFHTSKSDKTLHDAADYASATFQTEIVPQLGDWFAKKSYTKLIVLSVAVLGIGAVWFSRK